MNGYRYALATGMFLLVAQLGLAEESSGAELLRATGTLSSADRKLDNGLPVQWFPLALPAGTRIAIRIASVDFTPVIAIAEPGSDTLLRDGRNGTVGTAHTVRGNAGVQVGVSAAKETPASGQFTIRVIRLAAQQPLSVGAKRSGVLSYDDETLSTGEPVDWWNLDVRSGDRVAIVAESQEFSPAIVGVLPGGVELTPEQSPDEVSIVRFTSTRDGAVRVGISNFAEADLGAYQISVFRPSAPVALEVGQVVNGSLSNDDDMIGGQPVDNYLIHGMSGERVTINLSSDSFDTLLIVQEPDGTVDGNDDLTEDNLNSGMTYSFREEGTLEIRVYAIEREERGPYRLKLSPAAPIQSVSPGSTLRGLLSEGDELFEGVYADRYVLSGSSGQAVLIYLESEEFDTYLVVFAPDGTPIENDDLSEGISNSGLHFVFDTDGRIEILVTGYASDDIGEYRLRIEPAEPGSSPGGSSGLLPASGGPEAVQLSA